MSTLTIKQGYKQTDIGIIPEDWEVRSLGEVLKVKHGKDQKKIVDPNGKYKIFGTGGLMGQTNSFLYNKPSVLIGRKGTIDKPRYLEEPFWTVDTLFYTAINHLTLPKYIFYKFVTIDWYSYNEASGVPSLNASRIEKIQIPLPPLPEQIAIAAVLSDIDQLITSLTTLIAKKKQIKIGTMQKLLKPQDDWEVRKLVDVVDYIHGKAHEQFIAENGKYSVVNSKFISRNGTVIKYSDKNYCPAIKNDILTVLSDLPNGKALAKCYFVRQNGKFAVNQRVCIWRSKKDNSKFLFYILNRYKYFLDLDDKVSQTHILNHHIENCIISLPPLQTQTQIATILTDMDEEITALESKLAKYRLIKTGAMQELLTGRIRLV